MTGRDATSSLCCGAAVAPSAVSCRSAGLLRRTAVQAVADAGLVLKGKAPVSNEILKVKLPRPQEADLANGLHLMVLEDHRLPQITFQLIIPGAGGYLRSGREVGLADFTASLMREGTKTRTSHQISQELETMAASLNVGAGCRRRSDGHPAARSQRTSTS